MTTVALPGAVTKGPVQAPLHGSPSVHLDAIRGFAAFSVLLMHWRNAFFLDYHDLPHQNAVFKLAYFISGLGHQWVIVFFVMSGYLVGGSVVRSRRQNRWSWRSYLLTRLTRLYIVLIPALVLGGLADWAGMHLPGAQVIYSGNSGMDSLKIDVYQTLNLKVFVGNLLYMQTEVLGVGVGHHVPTYGSNGPLWSLSNEFWCYMVFPVILIALARFQSWRVRAGCTVLLAAWGWLVGIPYILMCISWFMGVLLVYLPPIHIRRTSLRRLIIAAGLVLFAVGAVLEKYSENPFTVTVLGLTVVAMLWTVLHCATGPLSAAYTWLAQRAARSSYTLYLIHMPVVVFLKTTLHLPLAAPTPRGMVIPCAVLIGTILYAQGVYELFEKNTDRLRNWIKPYVIPSRVA